jgi:hypothetical protein
MESAIWRKKRSISEAADHHLDRTSPRAGPRGDFGVTSRLASLRVLASSDHRLSEAGL